MAENYQRHLCARVGNKNDELYTQYKTVEVELRHHDFSGLRVYCPCDNYQKSNFVKYFIDNFQSLGIVSVESLDIDGNYFKYDGITETVLQCDIGGYGSSVSDKIKQNCDIIVTNPPFSNYRLFYEWLLDKKYIVICPITVLYSKWCFGGEWCSGGEWTTGYTGRLSGEYSKYISSCGDIVTVPTCYLTNMNVKYYLIKLPEYVNDDNIQYIDGTDIVNVNKLENINFDADYLQAVPVTILCHKQSGRFRVVKIFKPSINGKKIFYRVVIKVNK